MNIKNLTILRDGLISNPPLKLKMVAFSQDSKPGYGVLDRAKTATPDHPCKTSCCLVGYSPSVGIPINDDEDWWKYSERVFGMDFGDIHWSFCFGGEWPDEIPEAIARLTLAINGEIPRDWEWDDRFAS